MFTDWQTWAASLIVLAAVLYVGRRGWRRLRSFRSGLRGESSCATGCGKCGTEGMAKASVPRASVLVQIARAGKTKQATR